jgi:hypothetical protein
VWTVRQGQVRKSRWPAVDTFARAIETSDFERRSQLIEADHFDDRAQQPA